jgi:uncharacterized membrane protein YeiH
MHTVLQRLDGLFLGRYDSFISLIVLNSEILSCGNLVHGLSPIMAPLLGMLSGIGGMLRDVLVAEIPNVLRSDLYAVAALAGAIVVVIGGQLGIPPAAAAIVGAATCFCLRLLAIYRGWQLPRAHPEPDKD